MLHCLRVETFGNIPITFIEVKKFSRYLVLTVMASTLTITIKVFILDILITPKDTNCS